MTDTLKSVVEEELQKAYERGVQDGMKERVSDDKLDGLREMVKVQGYNGNWNYDSYMHGMYNGMEFMLSIVEDREPVYRDRPDVWLCELPHDKVIGDSEEVKA